MARIISQSQIVNNLRNAVCLLQVVSGDHLLQIIQEILHCPPTPTEIQVKPKKKKKNPDQKPLKRFPSDTHSYQPYPNSPNIFRLVE